MFTFAFTTLCRTLAKGHPHSHSYTKVNLHTNIKSSQTLKPFSSSILLLLCFYEKCTFEFCKTHVKKVYLLRVSIHMYVYECECFICHLTSGKFSFFFLANGQVQFFLVVKVKKRKVFSFFMEEKKTYVFLYFDFHLLLEHLILTIELLFFKVWEKMFLFNWRKLFFILKVNL